MRRKKVSKKERLAYRKLQLGLRRIFSCKHKASRAIIPRKGANYISELVICSKCGKIITEQRRVWLQ